LNCVADVCALRGHADDAPIVNSGEFAPVLEEVRGEATRKSGDVGFDAEDLDEVEHRCAVVFGGEWYMSFIKDDASEKTALDQPFSIPTQSQ
jgi:hypothetical protein